jgi:hypothetical protein
MTKLLANAVTAISLMLSASVAAPAWSAEKAGASKCHHNKSKLAKRSTAAIKSPPVRSVTLVEKRKLDVQILSFGP